MTILQFENRSIRLRLDHGLSNDALNHVAAGRRSTFLRGPDCACVTMAHLSGTRGAAAGVV
jgi:hypothetical protein